MTKKQEMLKEKDKTIDLMSNYICCMAYDKIIKKLKEDDIAYYGIEGTHSISLLNETNPTLYATRYISTKQFLSYYDKD